MSSVVIVATWFGLSAQCIAFVKVWTTLSGDDRFVSLVVLITKQIFSSSVCSTVASAQVTLENDFPYPML